MIKNRFTRTLFTLCLVVLLCLPVHALTIGDIETTDTMAVELPAKEYIEKFIAEIYLYEAEDLTTGTIVSAISDTAALANTIDSVETLYSINGEETVPTLVDGIEFFDAAANYYRYFRSSRNIQRFDFSSEVNVYDSVIHNNYAQVYLYSVVSFKYEPTGEPATGCDNYLVELNKIDGKWYITNVLSEELISSGLSAETFDYEASIDTFDAMLAQSSTIQDYSDDSIAEPAALIETNQSYNKNNAIGYAYTYTTSSYTGSAGNNYSFLNPNFFNYSELGGNCQNFASQCVWAGFGGNNVLTDINNFYYPMDRDGSYLWYGDKYGNKSPSWSECVSFYAYAEDSNEATSEDGLESVLYQLDSGNDFSSVTSRTTKMPGSVMHVMGGEGSFTHAILITEVTGSTADNVKFCGNSPMRKAYRLSDTTYPLYGVRIVIPTYMRRINECTNTAHSYTSNGCLCINCGYSKLVVSGSIPKCYPVGTAAAIIGSANNTCYRMAIGVTTPSGTTQWSEYSNTRTATKSMTFSETGLYTIQISGRDLIESNPYSTSSKFVYTIRVY